MLQTTVLLSVSYPTLHIIPSQHKVICIYWNTNMTGLVWQESTLSASFLVFYHEPTTNPKVFQAAGLTELEDRWTAQVPYLVAREEALYLGNNVRDRPRASRTRKDSSSRPSRLTRALFSSITSLPTKKGKLDGLLPGYYYPGARPILRVFSRSCVACFVNALKPLKRGWHQRKSQNDDSVLFKLTLNNKLFVSFLEFR